MMMINQWCSSCKSVLLTAACLILLVPPTLADNYSNARLHSLEVRVGSQPNLQIFSHNLEGSSSPCKGRAVYTGDSATMDRFIDVAMAAQLSGKVLGLWYTKEKNCSTDCLCTINYLELQND